MGQHVNQNDFLDYIENNLDLNEKDRITTHLDSCSNCRKEFVSYKAIMDLEKIASNNSSPLDTDLTSKIMNQIEKKIDNSFVPSETIRRNNFIVGFLSTITLTLTLTLYSLIDSKGFNNNNTVLASNKRPRAYIKNINNSEINYRKVTFEVQNYNQKNQILSPNKQVDITVSFTKDDVTQVATIGRFLDVISVDTEDNDKNTARVTILTPEKSAEMIEYAKVLGQVSILPVTNQNQIESATSQTNGVVKTNNVVKDLNGRVITTNFNPNTLKVLYAEDPNTGEVVRHTFKNGKWTRDNPVVLTAY